MNDTPLNNTALKVLTLLSNLSCYSGNDIAGALSLSRTAIWKQVNGLKEAGYVIESIHSKGYQLKHPLTPLLQDKIKTQLETLEPLNQYQIEVYPTLGSTNTFLKERTSALELLEVVLTEQQMNGRGRFNRQWHSPFGENIYLSMKKNLSIPLAKMSGFSLCISLALIEGLVSFGVSADNFSIKWPNDLLLQGKKIAGILIELSGEVGAGAQAVIGFGLNVMMQEAALDKAWTSLSKVFKQDFDRNVLAAHLIAAVSRTIAQFETQGFSAFKKRWMQYDALKGCDVALFFYDEKIEGTCLGIDESGNILIKQKDDKVKLYSAGEVSFKDRE